LWLPNAPPLSRQFIRDLVAAGHWLIRPATWRTVFEDVARGGGEAWPRALLLVLLAVFVVRLKRPFRARLRELATDGEGLPSVRVRSLVNRPRKPATPAVRQLATLAQQCAGDLGQQLPLGTTGGVCDGNNLQAAGLPVIDTLGVRGGGLHTNVEWIELPSLVQRAQLTALVLLRGFARRESV
jgi:hypothetical protein